MLITRKDKRKHRNLQSIIDPCAPPPNQRIYGNSGDETSLSSAIFLDDIHAPFDESIINFENIWIL